MALPLDSDTGIITFRIQGLKQSDGPEPNLDEAVQQIVRDLAWDLGLSPIWGVGYELGAGAGTALMV